MTSETMGNTSVTLPSDREIAFSRTFNAPRALVFEAWTNPEHVKRWWGPRGSELAVCEIDLRVGGSWTYTSASDGDSAYTFSGVFKEITPPERLVYTELFNGDEDHAAINTLTFDEQNGRTTLTCNTLYDSLETRDLVVSTGMETGLRETLERLAELLLEQQVAR